MTKDGAVNKGFSLPFARIALVLAALIAIAAIAITALRSRGGTGESAPPAATQPVGDIASMIGGLEKKLRDNPDDPKGWNLLGLAYYNVGRYADSVKAYVEAAARDPNNAQTWSALGEVQLLSGPGGVTPEAEASFHKALAIDPTDFRARYFIAVKKDASGDHKGALDDLIGVLRDSPPDAPWAPPVRELISRISTEHKIDVSGRLPSPTARPAPADDSALTGGIPGPTATDLKAATAMTPSQQDEMARGMVARLAARLEANPRDAERWIMLIRSRMQLKDPAGAQSALAGAKAAFKDDAAQRARFDAAAQLLGVPGR
ncbi:tetratricopeptide repeat protein [Rhizorhabdus argentea]|uniref:tetratricopeptide repeat protein n=1 Tax=Rhizorhabdus argentea TaxID=1387174 RepID=UPI0030ED5DA9